MYVTLDYQLVQDIAHQPYHSLEALTLPESTCNPLKSAKSWPFHIIILLSPDAVKPCLEHVHNASKQTVELKFPENNSTADCTGQPHHSHLQATISCKDIKPNCMIFGNIHKDYDMILWSGQ